jgi:hypothetical protein
MVHAHQSIGNLPLHQTFASAPERLPPSYVIGQIVDPVFLF